MTIHCNNTVTNIIKVKIMIRNTIKKYGLISKSFHWYMAGIILFVLLLGNLSEHTPKEYYGLLMLVHNSLGIILFGLVILRLLWRWSNTKPEKINKNRFQNSLSNFVFFIFYFGMFMAPITGYVLTNIEGKDVSFFGVELISVIGRNSEYMKLSHNFHGIAGDMLLYAFVLHFIAALYHHYIKKDQTLKRISFSK